MKNIGIIRRLDELGRIVIPREFRKTHRINVGDPLEIVALENGNIVISKVDQTSDLKNLADIVCQSLYLELGIAVAVASFDRFVSSAGSSHIVERTLPNSLTKMLKNRESYSGLSSDLNLGEAGYVYVSMLPILGFDDCFGGLFAFSIAPITDTQLALVKLAARLLGDTLQKY